MAVTKNCTQVVCDARNALRGCLQQSACVFVRAAVRAVVHFRRTMVRPMKGALFILQLLAFGVYALLAADDTPRMRCLSSGHEWKLETRARYFCTKGSHDDHN